MYRCNFCSSIDTLDFHPDETYTTCQDDSCTTCRRFEVLDKQVSELQSSLALLINERRRLKSELNRIHQSIIHRLPIEISTSIFWFYVHESDDPGNPIPRRRVDSALVLGAVCRAWRRIAWSYPHLWTSLKMELGPRVQMTRIQLAIEWLCRSGRLPLSIKLCSTSHLEKLEAEPYFSFIALLNQYSYRWYSLVLDLPDVLLSRFKDSQGVTNILHTLDIRTSQPSNLYIMQAAPRVVSICNLGLEHLHFKWKNITHFSSTHFRLDDVLGVLRRAPQLISCEFREVGKQPNRYTIDENHRPSIHPQLKSLTVEFDKGSSTTQLFFNSVTLPSLTDFRFYLADKKIPVRTLTSFLERSGCALEKLSLQETMVTGDDLIQITRLLPSLSYLLTGINYSNATDDDMGHTPTLGSFYSALSAHSIETVDSSYSFVEPLLPRLKTFKLFGKSTFPNDDLIKLIKGLFAPATRKEITPLRPLESVQMLFECDYDDPLPFIDQPTLDYISDLSQKGVQFDLKVSEVGHKVRDLRDIYSHKVSEAIIGE